jgi:hypothetical protein
MKSGNDHFRIRNAARMLITAVWFDGVQNDEVTGCFCHQTIILQKTNLQYYLQFTKKTLSVSEQRALANGPDNASK